MTTCCSRATGSGASGSPPWAAIMRRQTSIAEPSASALAGSASVQPGRVEHLAGQREGQLDHVGGAAARQDLDGLADLQRVAGGAGRAGWTCR